MAGAELVLATGVGPRDPGTDPVANTLWHDKTGHTPRHSRSCPAIPASQSEIQFPFLLPSSS